MKSPRVLLAIVAAAVFFGAFALPASAGSTSGGHPAKDDPVGGIGVRLTEAPVSAGDDPRAKVYIVDHLAPGTTIEREIEVSNSSATSQNVVLYPAAATIEDGTFTGAEGDTPNELSTWTSVTPSDLKIPAGGKTVAKVTIDVPADAAPGETYGVVWAEARSGGDGGGVVQVSRVGIRLYLSIGPGGAPPPDFTIDSLIASRSPKGLPVISANVKNTGGRALDMSGTLQMANGPGGLNAGPFPADLGTTLAIGDTQPVSITLDESLPDGPWEASITLKSGLTTRTFEATVTFPKAGETVTVDTREPESDRSLVRPVGFGIIGLLIVAGVVVVLRRRRRRSAPSQPADSVSAQEPDLPVNA